MKQTKRGNTAGHGPKCGARRIDGMCTRHAWDGGAPGQIDLIFASQDWFLRNTWLDQHIYSKTDHRLVIVEVERKLKGGEKVSHTKRPRSVQHWEAADDWKETIQRHLCEESTENWNTWSHKIRETALECRKDTRCKEPKAPGIDETERKRTLVAKSQKTEQTDLVETQTPENRSKREKTLKQAEQDDRAPPGEMGQNVGNERNYSKATTAIDKWLGSEEKLTGNETWGLDTTTFVKARKRLKALKNIPDGLTVEVLRSVPLELRAQLSTDMRRRLHELDMVKALRERTARTGRVHSECLMKNLAERGHSFTTPADPEVGVQTGPGIEVNRNVRVSARVRTHDEHRDGSRDDVTHTVFVTEIFPCLAPSFDWTPWRQRG